MRKAILSCLESLVNFSPVRKYVATEVSRKKNLRISGYLTIIFTICSAVLPFERLEIQYLSVHLTVPLISKSRSRNVAINLKLKKKTHNISYKNSCRLFQLPLKKTVSLTAQTHVAIIHQIILQNPTKVFYIARKKLSDLR